ncbi:MAG: Bax inhibitor-1/YccA family protein [Rhodospirillaceae bacterium]|nr:Bax inhibitor-1/YccA family protein [Rhodospirillaceae bacterium]
MVNGPDRGLGSRTIQGGYARSQTAEIDAGLRAHMQKVYAYMGGGLLLTGVISYFIGSNEALMASIWNSPLRWVAIFAPLGISLMFGFRIHAMRAVTAQALFWAYAALMGISLSIIFAVYTDVSIVKTFFVTAATFMAVSLYGYTTKKDLSGMGTFLFMGVIGLFIAMIVNIFLQSSALEFAISAIGVLVFTGLAAYDTQKIKEFYWEADGHEVATKKSILGAFALYTDFINLFLFMLRFLGNRE